MCFQDGSIYYSVTSTIFGPLDLILDLFTSFNGRLMKWDAKTGENIVLIEDIATANGIILSENEDFILVNEPTVAQTRKFHLKGPKKGQDEVNSKRIALITLKKINRFCHRFL